jgi:hypothetical protein
MSAKTLLVGGAVVVVAGVAAALGWVVLSDPPESPDAGGDPAVAGGELSANATSPGGNGDDDDANGRRRPPRDPEPVPAERPAGGALWVPVDGAPESIAALDWDDLGNKLAELVPLLADVANLASRGGVIDERMGVRASSLRIAVDDALAELDRDLPSAFPTDVLAHPVVAANAIAATLHARGMGLSSEQLASLRERAVKADSAETAAALGESEHAWRLTRAASIFERRRAYYAEFEELLTERQRRGLHSELSRGRVGLDVFCAAVVWDGCTQVTLVTDEPSIGVAAGGHLLQGMGLDPKLYEEGMEMVMARAATVPPEWFGKKGDWMAALGFVQGEIVTDWARWSVDVLLEVLSHASRGRLPAAPPDVLDAPVVLAWDPAL